MNLQEVMVINASYIKIVKYINLLKIHMNHKLWQNILHIQQNTITEICTLLKAQKNPNRTPKRFWMKNRNQYWWEETVNIHFEDEDWIETFRMKKSTFQYICEELFPRLEPAEPILKPPRKPLSVEKKVAVALYYLASCYEYRVVGNVFGIHKSTVWKCLHAVIEAINTILLPKWITMPDETECKIISSFYEDLTNIPQIIGALDGTHVPILPPFEGYRDYINRKGWPSIVLQAVVDSTLRFRNINCQAPGCSHDAAVLKESMLYKNADNLIPQNFKQIGNVHVPFFIMGDGAYPLLPWLMKAYGNTQLTPQQELFNTHFNRGRVHVEMAFGRLKSRWRTLLKRNELNYRFVPDMVAACCTWERCTWTPFNWTQRIISTDA